MSDEMAAIIGEAFQWAIGNPAVLGLILLGSIIYFFVVNRVDRGGIALVGLITIGYMARAPTLGGFGLLDVWIYYVIVAVVGVMAAIAFTRKTS